MMARTPTLDETQERTVHVLYRCSDCRATQRHTYHEVRTVAHYPAGQGSGRYWPASTGTVDLRYFDPATGEQRSRYVLPPRICPACSHGPALRARLVKGRVVARIRCESSCRTARGPKCDCECGGEHHGEAWALGGPP